MPDNTEPRLSWIDTRSAAERIDLSNEETIRAGLMEQYNRITEIEGPEAAEDFRRHHFEVERVQQNFLCRRRADRRSGVSRRAADRSVE